MRKIMIFAAFAALAMISSCQKDAVTEQESDELTFTASVIDQSTRTTVDALGTVSWEEGDVISVSDGIGGTAYYYINSASDIAEDGSATFTFGEGDRLSSSAEEYTAEYYGDYYESFPFIPQKQTYSTTVGKLPMSGKSDSSDKTKLNFTVTCSLLHFNLTAAETEIDRTIGYIEVSGVLVEEDALSFRLVCEPEESIASAKDFYLALPEGTYTDIQFTNSSGCSCYKTAKDPMLIGVNSICSLTFTDLVFDDKVPVAEPEYVDLGLSVKWATFNVGATKPEEYGKYFAWGDVVGQTWDGSWSGGGFSSYPEYQLDANNNLKPEYDAAHVNLSEKWRMPTHAEQQELIDNCTSTWTSDYNDTGIAGRIFTSKTNGNSIFLPAASSGDDFGPNPGSFGFYWSSTFYGGHLAWSLSFFDSGGVYTCNDILCFYGQSVRPVYGEYIPVTSISLSETNIGLTPSSSRQLTAAHQPENASLFTLSWSSSNKSVATVSEDGLVTAKRAGQCTITASVGTIKAECTVTVAEPEYVDLGLSVKWATFNIGASKPEEYGTYFAWGDVVGQTWSCGDWSGGGFLTYPAYKLDDNNNLKPEYDAAYVNWGSNWRMPTVAEQEELIDNCTSTWTDNYNGTGVHGRIFTSNKTGYTDKSIFLPAAGGGAYGDLNYTGSYGFYWLSTFGSGSYAWTLYFHSDDVSTSYNGRIYGLSVRPVYDDAPAATTGTAKATIDGEEVDVAWVQLWKDGPKFAVKNVGASAYTDNGSAMNFADAAKTGSAYVWGNNWKTPSKDEMDLLDPAKVSCIYTSENDVFGFEFTGVQDGYTSNSLFLPAIDGFGFGGDVTYWSSTANDSDAWYLILANIDGDYTNLWGSGDQSYSYYVRPILIN